MCEHVSFKKTGICQILITCNYDSIKKMKFKQFEVGYMKHFYDTKFSQNTHSNVQKLWLCLNDTRRGRSYKIIITAAIFLR